MSCSHHEGSHPLHGPHTATGKGLERLVSPRRDGVKGSDSWNVEITFDSYFLLIKPPFDPLFRRPGILVLINDTDWELENELQYEIKDGDSIVFISTLHGG